MRRCPWGICGQQGGADPRTGGGRNADMKRRCNVKSQYRPALVWLVMRIYGNIYITMNNQPVVEL